jgi:enamine deaminase RidA (YjgF/YER057c/UK114 family)
VPLNAEGRLVGGDDTSVQARAALTHLGHVLRSAGAGFGDVVKPVKGMRVEIDATAVMPSSAGGHP